MTDVEFNLMKYFPNSCIKVNKELILEERENVYFHQIGWMTNSIYA